MLRDHLGERGHDLTALRVLTDIDLQAGRIDAAQASLEIIIASHDGEVLAMNNLAWIYDRRQDARALPLARKAFAQGPSASTADTLGWILMQKSEMAPAMHLMQRAKAERPDDAAIGYHLAAGLNRTGRSGEARLLLEAIMARKAVFADAGEARALLATLQQTP